MLTTPGMTVSVTSSGSSTEPTAEDTRADAPFASPSRAASSGCTCAVQASLPRTSTLTFCVHELAVRSCRRPISTMSPCAVTSSARAEALEVGDQRCCGQLHLARLRGERVREPRLQRSQVEPVRMLLQHRERDPVRVRAERVAPVPRSQDEVEEALLHLTVSERGEDLIGIPAVDRGGGIADGCRHPAGERRLGESEWVGVGSQPGRDGRQADEDLELGRRSRLPLEHGR